TARLAPLEGVLGGENATRLSNRCAGNLTAVVDGYGFGRGAAEGAQVLPTVAAVPEERMLRVPTRLSVEDISPAGDLTDAMDVRRDAPQAATERSEVKNSPVLPERSMVISIGRACRSYNLSRVVDVVGPTGRAAQSAQLDRDAVHLDGGAAIH